MDLESEDIVLNNKNNCLFVVIIKRCVWLKYIDGSWSCTGFDAKKFARSCSFYLQPIFLPGFVSGRNNIRIFSKNLYVTL